MVLLETQCGKEATMVCIGTKAASPAAFSTRQRFTALKRIIPVEKRKAALRRSGRGRTLCPRVGDEFMLLFVVAMGLFASDCYRQVYRWLAPFKKGDTPGRSTLCEARHRLGVRALMCLAKQTVELLASPQTPGAFYQGLRLMTIDGFAVNLPDTPANEKRFGRPRNGRSRGAFPQAQVLALMEARTHVLWRWVIKGCDAAETCMAALLMKHLTPGMLLLWDRGFASFDLVKKSQARGSALLARWKKNRILLPVKKLSDGSFLTYIYGSEKDRKAGKNGILVRMIEYTLKDPKRTGHQEKHLLLTTLLDEKLHPAKTLVELYHVRWEEELAIDEVKTHALGRQTLRSQTPAGCVQEIHGLLLGHYVIRTLMFEAAKIADVSPLRISFTGTLKILRCRLPECPEDDEGRELWWDRLLAEISEETIPPRRNRINPRVIRRQQSKWPKKRAKHRNPSQPTLSFHDSIEILC
jgi:hypothetical protein